MKYPMPAVTCADAWIIGEDRDEMSGPDAEAGRGRAEAQPDEPRPPLCGLGTVEQVDGDSARQEADGARQHNETPVVVDSQAGKNPEHCGLSFLSVHFHSHPYLPG
jgi:hypothetical protein